MEIKIDTNKDSAADIEGAIQLLQNILKSRGHNVSTNISSNFQSTPSDDRLARKLAKAKAKEEVRSEPAVAPMGMFGTPSPELNPAPESEPTFNMFESHSVSNVEKSPITNMFESHSVSNVEKSPITNMFESHSNSNMASSSNSASDLLSEPKKEGEDDEPKIEILPY